MKFRRHSKAVSTALFFREKYKAADPAAPCLRGVAEPS